MPAGKDGQVTRAPVFGGPLERMGKECFCARLFFAGARQGMKGYGVRWGAAPDPARAARPGLRQGTSPLDPISLRAGWGLFFAQEFFRARVFRGE